MAIPLRIPVPAPDDKLREYGAGAKLHVESSATIDGVYVEISTSPLDVEETTFLYELADPAGSTATWYRSRFGNSGGTVFSSYGDPFSPSAPTSYADVDRLLLTMGQTVSGTRFLANAEVRLVETTRDLIQAMHGYSFFRSPVSGADEAREFTVGYDGVVHVHEGVISIESARIRRSVSSEWESIDVDDIRLEYWAGGRPATRVPSGEPYDHITLTGRGALVAFPATTFGIEFTGAWQWPSIPAQASEANVAWARQKLAADPSVSGGQISPDEAAIPYAPDRKPQAVYDLLLAHRERFWCHL